MLVFLFICVWVLLTPLWILSTWMKIRVNEELPEDRRLSWWSRNYRQVERIYREQHPDSIVPDLTRYGGYLTLALFAAIVLVRIIQRH
jgi:hypothetical protein